jgi:hypothetical protein
MAALALSLAGGLADMGKYRRQMRILFTGLLLTALLRPLTGLHLPVFPADDRTAEENALQSYQAAQAMQEEALSARTRSALNQALREQEIPCEVVEVSVHIQADGSIEITEVTAAGNLLTGTVVLREWLGSGVVIRQAEDAP